MRPREPKLTPRARPRAPAPNRTQPKETTDIRDFLRKSRRKDAKKVSIKRHPSYTKFKMRLSKYLVTLKVTDMTKADKIAQSFPPGLTKVEV